MANKGANGWFVEAQKWTQHHHNSTVKHAWARVVLGWVTSQELLVFHPIRSWSMTSKTASD